MQLEDSNGKVFVPKNVTEVTETIDCLGSGLEHCILSDGDMFIQTAGSSPRLVVEYQDPTGHYEAAELHSAQTVKDLFSAFFQKNDSWKTMVAYSRTGDAAAGPSVSTGDRSTGTGGTREKSFKDGLADSMKREVKNNLSRMVRRGVRNVFRKFR
jgi:hypothetical protein